MTTICNNIYWNILYYNISLADIQVHFYCIIINFSFRVNFKGMIISLKKDY